MALKIDIALAEYREKYLNINDIKELIGNFQGVLEDAFEKGYLAAQKEVEAPETIDNKAMFQLLCDCRDYIGGLVGVKSKEALKLYDALEITLAQQKHS